MFQKASYHVGQIEVGTGYFTLPCFLHSDPEEVSPQPNFIIKVKGAFDLALVIERLPLFLLSLSLSKGMFQARCKIQASASACEPPSLPSPTLQR